MTTRIVWTLSLLLLAGCPSGAPVPVIHPPDDTASCKTACDHIGPADLRCPEGEPLEDGTSCQKWCEDTQAEGHALNPSCVMLVVLCADIPRCQRNYNRKH